VKEEFGKTKKSEISAQAYENEYSSIYMGISLQNCYFVFTKKVYLMHMANHIRVSVFFGKANSNKLFCLIFCAKTTIHTSK